MIFYREGVTDVRAALAEVVSKGVDLSPKNIVDSESKIYGVNLPKNGDYSPESLARATLLLLRIVVKKYDGPATGLT
jgi:hypothetical protein